MGTDLQERLNEFDKQVAEFWQAVELYESLRNKQNNFMYYSGIILAVCATVFGLYYMAAVFF